MPLLLRYDDPAAVDHPLYARFATISPGAPGRCPDCDEFGFVEQTTLAGRSQTQRCRRCGCLWEYRFGEDDRIAEVHVVVSRTEVETTRTSLLLGEREAVVDLREPAEPAVADGAERLLRGS